MVLDLPLDLVDEILYKVPATSLIRLRSTCKRWNALFKDSRFTEKQFRKAASSRSMILLLKDYRICPVSVNLNVTPPSIKFQGTLSLKCSDTSKSKEVDVARVFHCDGVLLCTTKKKSLVVWNPCLGETRWIELSDANVKAPRFALGYIQNNKSCRNYKILRWWDEYDKKLRERVLRFEIYEFSSCSWRFLDEVFIQGHILPNNHIGVSSLNGNIYLLATKIKDGCKSLFSFDFTAERVKHLCLPLVEQSSRMMRLSVVREERLSILLGPSSSFLNMEIWVTNKIDSVSETELLWTRSFILDSLATNGNWFRIFTSL
ncbi:hypothetical protein CARUB_v10015509mg, partial [Capsella rubella]